MAERPLDFEIVATDGSARRGRLTTAHGPVETPAFMPVGTNATVKMMPVELLVQTGSSMILANAYHLSLRPGEDVIRRLGGLHRFMNWSGPILTDSGGYQVFSLAKLRRVTDDGVEFQSHVDGATLMVTPERAIEIQQALGADVIMAFDECVAYPCEPDVARTAMHRSVAWARRCKAAKSRPDQALFGIVQGSVFEPMRRECAERLAEIGFDGYAIGGLSVGEGSSLMNEVLAYTAPALPDDQPRYLMGVGPPEDLLSAVELGVDMFDCVMPTRNARGACAFTHRGKVRLRNAQYAEDTRPIEEACGCPACRHYTRAYLRHLFLAGEAVAGILTSLHNLWFYQQLMAAIREAIAAGHFDRFKAQFLAAYSQGEE